VEGQLTLLAGTTQDRGRCGKKVRWTSSNKHARFTKMNRQPSASNAWNDSALEKLEPPKEHSASGRIDYQLDPALLLVANTAVSSQIRRVNAVDGLRQISLQFRNNIVEQTSRERVCGFLLQHPIARYLIPALLPIFCASHVAMLPMF
jgi:hypothetical protein